MTNKIDNNCGESLQKFATFLSEIQTESLTPEQQKTALSLITELSENVSLSEKDKPATLELKSKITSEKAFSDVKKIDVKKIFITFLRNSSDELISSVLKLHTIQALHPFQVDRARNAIIHCFKNQSTSLFLTNCGLISLPESIFDYLDHLQELFCPNNELISLPSPLPANLRVLRCSLNRLTSLPSLPATLQEVDCFRGINSSLFLFLFLQPFKGYSALEINSPLFLPFLKPFKR